MLILTRRQNETIELPDLGIRIVVARIDGDAVRIGIDAPRTERIYRGEVWEAISRHPESLEVRE